MVMRLIHPGSGVRTVIEVDAVPRVGEKVQIVGGELRPVTDVEWTFGQRDVVVTVVLAE